MSISDEEHPVDVLLKMREEIDEEFISSWPKCEWIKERAEAITWVLDKCEAHALVLAMLRNADADLAHSTDLAVRLEAQATKDKIYAEIDRSSACE